MRLAFGPIPENRSFLEADPSWRPIREPSAFWAQIVSLPLGGVAALVVVVLILVFSRHLVGYPGWWTVPALLLLFPIHEAIHLLFHPRQGRSPHSIAGFWPKLFIFYAHWDSSWSKPRFAACLGAPLLSISFLPLLLTSIWGLGGPTVACVMIANAAASGVDLLGILLILQVPSRALVQNAGWKTYWKPR